MFQFNENDLDFGIYKIYNLKRKHIKGFIDGDSANDLAPTIETTLKEVNLENQKTDAIELYNFFKKLNKESLLEEPEKNYDKIKGQLELDLEDESQKNKLIDTLNNLTKSEGLTDELKDKIYNHILGFFQMYYSNGDFGYNDRSRDLYKVPYEADYNGSDTMFHWKHKGSLYIKTGTSFNAIKFELKGKKIEYRLETNENSEDEGTSQNNNKDSQLKHYRFDRIEKIKDKATKETIYQVVFNLSDASTSKVAIFKAIYKEVFKKTEIDKYLEYTKDDKTKQVFVDLTKDFDKVQNGAIKGLSALRQKKLKIEKAVKNNFDRGVHLYDEETKQFTDETLQALYTLDQKLNSFYIGNDADYFIHENLNEFLTNEKNRYVKNYIFDDLESIYSGKLDNTTLLIAKAFDKVGTRIIEFLSAIEDFQKHLFTKKKKVVENEYCITIDYINEAYYKEILENKIQLQEWQNLFSLEVKTIEDIKANPTLVLDTKCFKQTDGRNSFKDKILAEIDNLDEKTNGLLINSENYQALEVLENKYRSKIDTIYIDPPYNSPSSSIIYKNNFKHSSWATLMFNRIKKAKSLLKSKGCEIIAIDENEQNNLFQIVSEVYPINNYDNVLITVEHNKKGIQGDHFSYSSEFAIFSIPFELKKINRGQ
jgi:adenine-specific DNA-methyltransferase